MTEKSFESDDTTIFAIRQVIETLGGATVQAASETTDDSYDQERLPMAASRPGWLVEAIDSDFADIEIGTRKYAAHGTTGDYFLVTRLQ